MASNIILIHLNLSNFFDDVRKFSIIHVNTDNEPLVRDVICKIMTTFEIDSDGAPAEECIAIFCDGYFLPVMLPSITLSALPGPLLVQSVKTTHESIKRRKINLVSPAQFSIFTSTPSTLQDFSKNHLQQSSCSNDQLLSNESFHPTQSSQSIITNGLTETVDESVLNDPVKSSAPNAHSSSQIDKTDYLSELTENKDISNQHYTNADESAMLVDVNHDHLNNSSLDSCDSDSVKDASYSSSNIGANCLLSESKKRNRKRHRKHNKRLKREKKRLLEMLNDTYLTSTSAVPGTGGSKSCLDTSSVTAKVVNHRKDLRECKLKPVKQECGLVTFSGKHTVFDNSEDESNGKLEVCMKSVESDDSTDESSSSEEENEVVEPSCDSKSAHASSPIYEVTTKNQFDAPSDIVSVSNVKLLENSPDVIQNLPRVNNLSATVKDTEAFDKLSELMNSNEVAKFTYKRSTPKNKPQNISSVVQKDHSNSLINIPPPRPKRFPTVTEQAKNEHFSISSIQKLRDPLHYQRKNVSSCSFENKCGSSQEKLNSSTTINELQVSQTDSLSLQKKLDTVTTHFSKIDVSDNCQQLHNASSTLNFSNVSTQKVRPKPKSGRIVSGLGMLLNSLKSNTSNFYTEEMESGNNVAK